MANTRRTWYRERMKNQTTETKAKQLNISGGELFDWPGHWKITGRVEGESDSWSVVRRPDGTFWQVAGTHYFPPTGGTVRIDLGDQIVDAQKLARCEDWYEQLKQKLEEKQSKSDGV
jgi:hypothetical protein